MVFLLVLYKKGIRDTHPYTSQIPLSLYPSPSYNKRMVGFFFISSTKYEKIILTFPNCTIISASMKHTDCVTKHDISSISTYGMRRIPTPNLRTTPRKYNPFTPEVPYKSPRKSTSLQYFPIHI